MNKNQKFKVLLILFLVLISFSNIYSQVTMLVKVPKNTPQNDNIFIAGNFNNWNPGNAIHQLTKINDSIFSITFPSQSGTIQYKFTRGDWDKVEVTASGGTVANRTFTFGNGQTLNISVGNWEDLTGTGGAQHTANGNVSIVSTNFSIPQLNRTRRIWIYLPTDYASSTKTYPVLYMHDGQNLFDAFYSFSGEWGVDEALAIKQTMGDAGVIVIGIDHGGSNRLNEYNPFFNPLYGGGEGDEYMEFIVDNLKPYIDSVYRTKSDRENTGIAGSSMGGLISLYGGVKYQQVFSKVGVFSPAFWIAPSLYTFVRNTPIINAPKIFIIGGGNESGNLVNEMQAMVDTLNNAGYPASNIKYQVKPDGQHSEWFWKREFPAVYTWLFANTTGLNSNNSFLNFSVFPNPASDQLTIQGDFESDKISVELSDTIGKLIFKKKLRNGKNLDLPSLTNGMYLLKVSDGNKSAIKKVFIQKN